MRTYPGALLAGATPLKSARHLPSRGPDKGALATRGPASPRPRGRGHRGSAPLAEEDKRGLHRAGSLRHNCLTAGGIRSRLRPRHTIQRI
eukprot:1460033-Pyramimonas_sp.AAC.2